MVICRFVVWWFGLMISWSVSGKLICWICQSGWTDERTNRRTNEQTNRRTNERINEQTNAMCSARRALNAGVWSKQKTNERTNERTTNALNELRNCFDCFDTELWSIWLWFFTWKYLLNMSRNCSAKTMAVLAAKSSRKSSISTSKKPPFFTIG